MNRKDKERCPKCGSKEVLIHTETKNYCTYRCYCCDDNINNLYALKDLLKVENIRPLRWANNKEGISG